MKILILGSGQHGKDTAAEIIRDIYGLSFSSSSFALRDNVVWPVLRHKYGYLTPDECYEDRANHREEWYQLLSDYNTPDKARLCKLILSQNDMYVGMRCPLELEASRHLFDHILWVDASGRKPREPSMRIEYDSSMILIDNNGSECDLENEITHKLNGILGP